MNTTKRFFLFAFSVFILGTTHNLNAQVTIGAETAPEFYSLLELNTDDVKAGLRLPQLSADERTTLTGKLNALAADKKAATKGLTIFNTTTNCTDTWNGSTWVSNCSDNSVPKIITQPRAFNWAETITATTMMGVDAAGTANLNSSTLSVVATGGAGTLSYQWYEVPANQSASPTKITTNGTSASYTPSLGALGMRRYFCRVTDAKLNTVDSEIAEVAVGCGAKTVQGGWLGFMCYNLGATNQSIALQKDYPSPTYSYTTAASVTATDAQRNSVVYGDLYQWGRRRNGHRLRTNKTLGAAQIAASTDLAHGNAGGNFIKGFFDWATINASTYSSTNDLNWRNYRNADYDPCDAGWRVPSQDEWASIFKGNSAAAFGSATANTWSWYAGATKGYEIKPDGLTTTLFLPAAGYRGYNNGELYDVGAYGYYWSGTISSTYSLDLTFGGTSVNPATIHSRAYGFSVRCVSEF